MNKQLLEAVAEDDIERVKHLLAEGASANARNEYAETVLIRACWKKNKAMVQLLLKSGAAVNETDNVGRTALMIAAREGDKEIFDLQLEYDADVVQVDWRGRAVIHLAAWKNQKTIVDHLLCCWGVDVDMVDLDGFTPLCWAVMAGHVDCVDVLLVHGADPNHKSKKDVSPIDIAKAKGYTVIASMMMEALRSPSRQYATSVISKLKEKNQRLEKEINQLKKEKEGLQEELNQVEVAKSRDNQPKDLLKLYGHEKAMERTDQHEDDLGLPSYILPLETQPFLGEQGWTYDVFICHADTDISFAELLHQELLNCGLKAFAYKECVEKVDSVRLMVANTVISTPFFVVVLSDSFNSQLLTEAEANAALAFSKEHKEVRPIFYDITAKNCQLLNSMIYQMLADVSGWNKESRTDEEFAKAISQDMRRMAEKQLHSGDLRLWKPNGEDWKPKRKLYLPQLTQLKDDLCGKRTGEGDDSFHLLDIRTELPDGTVQPVTSSVSRKMGTRGGKIEFPRSDVFLDIPQDAIPFATKFSLKTYIDPAHLPPVTSVNEVLLSPAFYLSSSLPQNDFCKPLQISLPIELPEMASDNSSGWLLRLKRSTSFHGQASAWHTILELNTETGEVASQSSSVHYDHISGTIGLDHFCRLAWLGNPLNALSGIFCSSPLRQILYVVFGKQIQLHKWLVATYIIHGSPVVYESLVHKLKERDYVELTLPSKDCIKLDGKISLCYQCIEPWKVHMGKSEVKISTNRIWDSEQHQSCYHEITVEDNSCSANTLECTVEASFCTEYDEDAGDSVFLVISHLLLSTTKPSARVALSSLPKTEDLLDSSTPDSASSKIFQAVLKYGVEQWFSIGLEMGFTSAQIKAWTHDIPSHFSKLQALIEQKVRKRGVTETEKSLLDACRNIPQSIIGAVLDYIEIESSRMC